MQTVKVLYFWAVNVLNKIKAFVQSSATMDEGFLRYIVNLQ
jgi:hypothetical protein